MAGSGVSFGVHLPSRALRGGDPEPVTPTLLAGIVDSAKEAGFNSVWVTDHIVYFDPWMDCMLLLAAVAPQAKK